MLTQQLSAEDLACHGGLPARKECVHCMDFQYPHELVNCLWFRLDNANLPRNGSLRSRVSGSDSSLSEALDLDKIFKVHPVESSVEQPARSLSEVLIPSTEEGPWEHDLNLHGTEPHLFPSEIELSTLVLHLMYVFVTSHIFLQKRN